jgi:hypothetical protein
MMLSDLDELILSCEDPRSRQYIEEAVRCYKAGAYRSSVVACWIAVAFDLVDKIRELAAGGDKAAQAEITRFETIQKANNLPGALAFEKELPLMARDKFEFISHLEHLDLGRLVEDRNRCAHPSQVSDNQVFAASAELARMHIYNSVKSILSKPASQGKAALARILSDIESKFFPNNIEDAVILLDAGPLKRCRTSLYENLLRVLLKTTLTEGVALAKRNNCELALSAIKAIHPNYWEEHFSRCLKGVVEHARDDDTLAVAVVGLVRLRNLDMWRHLPKPEQLRFLAFIENSPPKLFNDFDWFYIAQDAPAEFRLAAGVRIMKASFEELDSAAWILLPPQAIDRLLVFYANSDSFASANTYGRLLAQFIQEGQPTYEQADELVRIASVNGQVEGSNELPKLLRKLNELEWGEMEFDALFIKHDLKVVY